MKYIPILFLLFNTVIQAQDFPYWNDISEGNLEMTIYENDTIAAAVVLVNYGKTRFKIYNDYLWFNFRWYYSSISTYAFLFRDALPTNSSGWNRLSHNYDWFISICLHTIQKTE